MQRTAICLVAVLALLAGCSGGVGGGSDATQTQTPDASPAETTPERPASTPEPRPEPNTSDTTSSVSGPATTRLDQVSVNRSRVLEGEKMRFDATITNRNDTVANQTLTLQVGTRTVRNTSLKLAPRETRTVHLLTLNTSAVEPGKQFATVATENDSEVFQVEIRPKNELQVFIENVDDRSLTLENATVLGADHVRLTFDAEQDLTGLYRRAAHEPVPQAAAFEMATGDYAPSNVTVRILSAWDAEEISYRTRFNESLATKLYNGTVDAREFRDTLHRRATGDRVERYVPHWQSPPPVTPERFTFFGGDRARWAYVTEVAERLNNTDRDYLTIDGYGLYNGTHPLPDTTRTLGPNASVYITLQMAEINGEAPYQNFTSGRHAVGVFETMFKYGNMTRYRTYGERPDSIRVRYVWPDGSLHSIVNIPTEHAIDTARSESVSGQYLPLVFTDLEEKYELRLGD